MTGQHSLRSGIQDFDTYFDYSKSISDYFLTWGGMMSLNQLFHIHLQEFLAALINLKEI